MALIEQGTKRKSYRVLPHPKGARRVEMEVTHLNHLGLKSVGLYNGRDGGGRREDGAGHGDDRLRAQDEAAALRRLHRLADAANDILRRRLRREQNLLLLRRR